MFALGRLLQLLGLILLPVAIAGNLANERLTLMQSLTLSAVGVLVFSGFLFLLRLFVAELAVVHQPADGRRRVGRDFDQVHSLGAGQVDRLAELQNTELFAVLCDDPDFAGTNFPVDPDERTSERRRTRRERAAQDTLDG